MEEEKRGEKLYAMVAVVKRFTEENGPFNGENSQEAKKKTETMEQQQENAPYYGYFRNTMVDWKDTRKITLLTRHPWDCHGAEHTLVKLGCWNGYFKMV